MAMLNINSDILYIVKNGKLNHKQRYKCNFGMKKDSGQHQSVVLIKCMNRV